MIVRSKCITCFKTERVRLMSPLSHLSPCHLHGGDYCTIYSQLPHVPLITQQPTVTVYTFYNSVLPINTGLENLRHSAENPAWNFFFFFWHAEAIRSGADGRGGGGTHGGGASRAGANTWHAMPEVFKPC